MYKKCVRKVHLLSGLKYVVTTNIKFKHWGKSFIFKAKHYLIKVPEMFSEEN